MVDALPSLADRVKIQTRKVIDRHAVTITSEFEVYKPHVMLAGGRDEAFLVPENAILSTGSASVFDLSFEFTK